MMPSKSTLTAVVCLFWLCGCTTAPTPRYYLLDSGFENGIQKSYQKVARVRLPSYLQTGSLVLQVGPQELRVASFHFWAESLEQGFARAFDMGFESGEPESTSGKKSPRIVIDVKRFHGDLNGKVSLVADWKAVASCGNREGSFAKTIEQAEGGYPALVAAQVQLVEMMAFDVSEKLKPSLCL